VFSHPGDAVPTSDYTAIGDVNEFSYGETLGAAFRSGNLASLSTLGSTPGWVPAQRAVVFTDNHDTQRGGGVLTPQDGPLYVLGNVFELAYPFGTPVVMSSFRNATAGAAVRDWWSDGGDQVAFGRGNRGYVVVNRGGAPLSRTFQTSLARGTYCDVVHGDVRNRRCTGPIVTVDDQGRLTATVGAMDALAVHADSRVPS
jgi:alpha-amylase